MVRLGAAGHVGQMMNGPERLHRLGDDPVHLLLLPKVRHDAVARTAHLCDAVLGVLDPLLQDVYRYDLGSGCGQRQAGRRADSTSAAAGHDGGASVQAQLVHNHERCLQY